MKIRTQCLKSAIKAALISATSLASVGAYAQNADPVTTGAPSAEAETLEDEIVVTGTSIKGVVPIGSSLQTVGIADLEKTAATNLSTLVNTIPALSTNGSLAQGENLWSFYSPQIHQLGGSSSNTTLVVIDGMRSPGGGAQFNQIDPNIIPTSAIERVDVLADGASSVYGSDAVAGVVNFITRKRFSGTQVNTSYGKADSYDTWDLNGLWGTEWETGGVYAAASYSYGSQLFVKDRDWASRGDYRPYGGTNTNSFTCDPASIQVTGVSSGTVPAGNVIFLSPSATTPVANQASANGACNLSMYNSFIPSQYRTNALLRVENEFSEKLTLSASLVYNRNQTHVDSGPGQLNGARAFGPGGSAVTGQQNPFFTAPAGAPTANIETINWLATREDGKYGFTESQQDVIYGNVVLDYQLSDSWSLQVADSIGWNRSSLDGFKQFCGACAMLSLNGTTQSGGSTTASSVPGQSVVVTQLPLTTSNALDVWNPLGTNRTSPLVLNSLYTNNTQNNNYNTFNQLRAVVQGDLFNLPAGPVKLAVGGEHMWQEQQFKLSGGNNTGPTTTGSGYRVLNFDRSIVSAFAEVAVPVISPEMDIPGLYQIDVSLAARYDDFSDVGDTTNPKYGINWSITKGLRVRGNYAESFVAPPIAVIGDASQGFLYASGSVTSTGTINVPVAAYPTVADIPTAVEVNTTNDCTSASTVCTIGQGNTAMRRQLGGGFSQMGPQFGESYSFGIDFAPSWLEGFRSQATFFHNDFTGGVNSPSAASITASGSPLLTICPSTGCTQAQILEFANVANGATIGGSIPTNVYYLIDQSARNWLNLSIEGFDAQFDYNFNIGDKVSARFGANGTYFTKYDQFFGTNPEFSVLNTSGFNGVFSSIQFKSRANVGVDIGKVSTDLFWNHIGSYKNWGGSTFVPVTRDANGNPTGGGDTVDATNTFDLHVAFKLELGGVIDDMNLSLDVRNLTDEEPAFFNGNQGGFMGGAWGYDNYTANPVGRLITLGIRTNF